MALPRYQGGNIKPQTGGGELLREQSRMFGSLSDRIDSFASQAVNQYAQDTAVEAKRDAEKAFTQTGMKAKINEDMTVYSQTYSNALTNMHKKQLAIDTGKSVQQAFQSNESNPLGFEEATKEIYNNTSELLPDHLRAEYAIDFEANKAHYQGQVQNNRIKLDKQRDVLL